MRTPRFDLMIHYFGRRERPDSFAVEMTPKEETWPKFFAAIPLIHRDGVLPLTVRLAPRGAAPFPDPHQITDDGWISEDGHWWISCTEDGIVTSQISAFYYCRKLPLAITFGATEGEQHHALLMAEQGKPNLAGLPAVPKRLRRREPQHV